MKNSIEELRSARVLTEKEEKFGYLVLWLSVTGRDDDIERATTDEVFRNKLYKEFHVK